VAFDCQPIEVEPKPAALASPPTAVAEFRPALALLPTATVSLVPPAIAASPTAVERIPLALAK